MGDLGVAVSSVGHLGIGPGGRVGIEEVGFFLAGYGFDVHPFARKQAADGGGHVAKDEFDLADGRIIHEFSGLLYERFAVPTVRDEEMAVLFAGQAPQLSRVVGAGGHGFFAHDVQASRQSG